MPTLTATFEPAAPDVARLREEVIAHGRAQAGVGTPRPVACLAHEAGRLVGGASGRIEFARLFVEYLWVEAAHRRRGLGSALLAETERAARAAGCRDALIETLADDTAALYRRLGWVPIAEIADYVPGFTRHVLVKALAG
jgi:GNAT superfamily N-acetyltransferase